MPTPDVDVSNIVITSSPGDPDRTEAVIAAAATARQEVAGFAPTNGTRQAVEALAAAVEALVC